MQRQSLETMTLVALKALAREMKVPRRTALRRKAQLIDAILTQRAGVSEAPVVTHTAMVPDAPSSAPAQPARQVMPPNLAKLGAMPERYHQTKVAVMVQKPNHLYAYWEATDSDLIDAKNRAGDPAAKLVLRVHELSDNSWFDLTIHSPVGDWFFRAGDLWHEVRVDLGVVAKDGRFVTLAESLVIMRPADAPSDNVDPRWAVRDETFTSLYALSGGASQGATSADLQQMVKSGWLTTGQPGSSGG